MLLQRIRLKGFLGHRGAHGGGAGDGFVEVDFSTAPLWLVHGANGSGKSSLWDAVTFALFEQHRASGTDAGKTPKYLVHDECDKAEIFVEFDLEGGRYRACAEIVKPRRKNGSASTNRIIQRWTGDDWGETVAEGGKQVDEWVRRNLRISYETFTSAVLLRQGEADAFIKAKPKPRRARLIELLQLDFYRKLGDAAESRRRKCKVTQTELQKALDALPNPPAEELEAQEKSIEELRRRLRELEADEKAKENEKRDAAEAADLVGQIEEFDRKLRADQALFDEADRIEGDARLYGELKEASSRLENFWDARRQLDGEEAALSESLERVKELEERVAALASDVERRRVEVRQAAEAERDAKDEFERARQHQLEAQRRAGELRRVEALERDIAAEEAKLERHRPALSRRMQIERDFAGHEELREAIPLLRAMTSADERLRRAREAVANMRAEVERREEEQRKAADEERRLAKAVEELERERDAASTSLEECRGELRTLRDRLERRNEVSGEDKCPYCGSELKNKAAMDRLAREHESWHERASHLEGEETRLSLLLEERTRALKSARSELKAAGQSERALSSQLEGVRRDLEHADREVERAGEESERRRAEAGAWADRAADLTDLESKLSALGNAPNEMLELAAALSEEREVNAAIAICRKQLDELPSLSTAEREKIVLDAGTCEEAASAGRRKAERAEASHAGANEELNKLLSTHAGLRAELDAVRKGGEDGRRRRKEAEERFEQRKSEIPAEYVGHPACEDEGELKSLKLRRDGLHYAEAKLSDLAEARDRKAQLEGSISALRGKLDTIPVGHRRPVATVEGELDEIGREKTCAAAQQRRGEERLTELSRQRLDIEKKEKERDGAEAELHYFSRLAEELGSKGLEGVVVRAAQDEVKERANETLRKLSKDCLEIDLEGMADSEELQIRARDLSTGSLRLFEYLSGGEKFRVAVSLAVAIGQSASGAPAAKTLVIDEGFGTLDEDNRDQLVKVLSDLSDTVLCGGRVVVVSHQEDVCEDFISRYQIVKEKDGYICVESSAVG